MELVVPMRVCLRFPLLPGLALLFCVSHLPAAPLPHSVSPSRQFILYGSDVRLRGAVSDLAERTKSDLLKVLQRRDNWSVPIILNLQFPQANVPELPASELHFSQTGVGLKIQLDLTVTNPIDIPAMQRELVRALFVEMIYRNRPGIPAGTEYSAAPAWLVESILSRGGSGPDESANDLLRDAVASGQVMPLSNLLQQRPELLDASMRKIYRAYANALLQLLLDQPGGAAKLNGFIDGLPDGGVDQLTELQRLFPDLADEEKAAVLWKTAIARAATATRQDFLLTFDETERRLTDLLQRQIPGATKKAKPIKVEDLGQTKPTALQVPELRMAGENLLLLAATAHPLLHPIVGDYQDIVQRLAARKNGHARQRFAALKETRARLNRRVSDMADYMNWYEGTQLGEKSRDFRSYFKAAAGSDDAPHRRDPLSVYLDTIEAQF